MTNKDDVILEKIKSLHNYMVKSFDENSRDHDRFCKKQIEINQRVKKLEYWKASLIGILGVTTFIFALRATEIIQLIFNKN